MDGFFGGVIYLFVSSSEQAQLDYQNLFFLCFFFFFESLASFCSCAEVPKEFKAGQKSKHLLRNFTTSRKAISTV